MSVAPTSLMTRLLLVTFGTLSLLLTTPQARAQDKVLRVGTLKLIHGITPYFYEKFAPPGYTVEVIPFESPTDGKNAVFPKAKRREVRMYNSCLLYVFCLPKQKTDSRLKSKKSLTH